MKYIVEVREPVPSNLDEIAGKVAASFHISDDKALALLRRAPGAVTRAVSEREADVVAGIFERAGLIVVKRPADVAAPAQAGAATAAHADAPEPPAAEPTGSEPTVTEPPVAEPPVAESMADEAGADAGLGHDSGAPTDAEDVWDRPLEGSEPGTVDGFSRRDGFDAEGGELAWETDAADGDEADAAFAAGDAIALHGDEGALEVDDAVPDEVATDDAVPEIAAQGDPVLDPDVGSMPPAPPIGAEARAAVGRASQTPEMARRSQTPETLRSTLTRAPVETKLQHGGLRRRVALTAILPALLTLVVMGVAMLVTVLPVLRSQQQARAAGAAHAEATTLEALTGGMPLTAQTLAGPLTDLARRSQSVLGSSGTRMMIVTDATGVPVAGWYGAATTPAAMPPDVRSTVSGHALDVVAGQTQVGESFVDGLLASWHGVLAMLGLGSVGNVYAAAPVMSAGRAVGAVVVGVEPVSTGSLAENAFLTTLLVGLVPVLVAILVAMGLTRGLRGQVTYLLEAADRISRGDLEEPVELDSRDELGQLARAIERMRVSLQEGMERLRRRH